MAAELTPGSPSPLAQPPVDQSEPLSENIQGGLNPLILPAFNSDLGAPVQRPGTLASSTPPSAGGGGPFDNIPQSSLALPQGLTSTAANQVPLIAVPVLSRLGAQYNSWAASVALAGKSTVTVRGSYHELRIEPGFRGLQIQYPAGSGVITIRENLTGMVYTLPTGPQTIFLPLFMAREIFDLTFSTTGTFPAAVTALLTTEEQLPYSAPEQIIQGNQFALSTTNQANAAATVIVTNVPGLTKYITQLIITFGGSTAGGWAEATLSSVNNSGVATTLRWQLAVPVGAGVQGAGLNLTFSPPLQQAPGLAPTVTLPALGVGSTNACITVIGFAA